MAVDLSQKLRDLVSSGSCVLFLGSGVTREAGGPTEVELAQLLADKFSANDIPTGDLTKFSDILCSIVDREEVDKFIVETLKSYEPTSAHLQLPAIPWKGIFTTNYDRLVEISYDTFPSLKGRKALQNHRVVCKTTDQSTLINPAELNIYKLHGCISDITQGNPLVLTSADYHITKKKRKKMLRVLKTMAQEHAIIFIGFSLDNRDLLDLFNEIKEESPYDQHRKMYLVAPSFTKSEDQYYRSQNIDPIAETFGSFMSTLETWFSEEDRRKSWHCAIGSIESVNGESIAIPTKLRMSLHRQIEYIKSEGQVRNDPRKFLTGFPLEIADLRNRNDIFRNEEETLKLEVIKSLESEEYIRPMTIIVGPGGAGKSTLASRVAYNISEMNKAVSIRLKNPDLWNNEDIVEFGKAVKSPIVFVADGLEVRGWFRALKNLRNDLSRARINATFIGSCQKTIWNEYTHEMGDQGINIFCLDDHISRDEASRLIDKLSEAKLLTHQYRRNRNTKISHIVEYCEGHLLVALLELVRNGEFQNIVLKEYENVTDRAKMAYTYIALLHQHRIPTPDYLLNALTVKDWEVFIAEVIRAEAELVIVQDVDSAGGRLWFRSRHPSIAKVVIDNVVPKHEDRIRMYRKIFKELGTSLEDRKMLLTLLTTDSVRGEIREEKYMHEFFEIALDLFPEDRNLILQFGRYENKIGNFDRAKEILEWGRSLDPHDTHILHQLGVCAFRRGQAEEIDLIKDAHFHEAQRLYQEVQEYDPVSKYGYLSEIRLLLHRAKRSKTKEAELNLLSEAEDTLTRGLDFVREDDFAILKGCRLEIANFSSNPDELIEEIKKLQTQHELRFGSLYHLWASCLVRCNKIDEALTVIHEGLGRFPGDERLTYLVLEILEQFLHKEKSREIVINIIEKGNHEGRSKIRVLFTESVIRIYTGQYHQANDSFREIRERLASRASSRIRIKWSDEMGTTLKRHGVVYHEKKGIPWIQDIETGMKLPMDNHHNWGKIGKPAEIFFEMGFSLSGQRGTVLQPYCPPSELST